MVSPSRAAAQPGRRWWPARRRRGWPGSRAGPSSGRPSGHPCRCRGSGRTPPRWPAGGPARRRRGPGVARRTRRATRTPPSPGAVVDGLGHDQPLAEGLVVVRVDRVDVGHVVGDGVHPLPGTMRLEPDAERAIIGPEAPSHAQRRRKLAHRHCVLRAERRTLYLPSSAVEGQLVAQAGLRGGDRLLVQVDVVPVGVRRLQRARTSRR